MQGQKSPAQRRRSWRLPQCTCRTQGFGCTGAASLSWTSSFLALFVLEDPYSRKPCLGLSLNCCWIFLGEDKPRSVLPSFLTLFLCLRASVYGETVLFVKSCILHFSLINVWILFEGRGSNTVEINIYLDKQFITTPFLSSSWAQNFFFFPHGGSLSRD